MRFLRDKDQKHVSADPRNGAGLPWDGATMGQITPGGALGHGQNGLKHRQKCLEQAQNGPKDCQKCPKLAQNGPNEPEIGPILRDKDRKHVPPCPRICAPVFPILKWKTYSLRAPAPDPAGRAAGTLARVFPTSSFVFCSCNRSTSYSASEGCVCSNVSFFPFCS